MSALLDLFGGKPIGPLVFPVSPNREVTMVLPGRLTEAEWEQFQTILKAMMPALVREDPNERSAGSGPASPGQ
jgi:hypothetical protein